MRKTVLGRTGLTVTKNSFGALPIQRLSVDEAVELLKSAYNGGMTLFDTARSYSDSELKLGKAFSGIRGNVVIATKTPSLTEKAIFSDCETSLSLLQTDYIDIYQFHNPGFTPAGDSEAYGAMTKLKAEGKIRFIGVTCHKIENAIMAIDSGLYDTVQYPLSCLSTEAEFDMVRLAQSRNVGILCMKAMCGGLLTSAAPSMAVLDQFEMAVPIFGVQKQSELSEILALDANPPKLDEKMLEYIEGEKAALLGDFCRGCGYCLPCPAEIEIPMAARMSLLLNRAPWQRFVTPEATERMERIENCQDCGGCTSRCPYKLDTPNLLKKNLEYFKQFRAEKGLS